MCGRGVSREKKVFEIGRRGRRSIQARQRRRNVAALHAMLFAMHACLRTATTNVKLKST